MMPIHRLIASVAVIGVLSACGGLLPKPKDAPRQYTLSGMQTEIQSTPLQFGSLEVQRPTAAPGLDSERVANQISPHRLDYLADARWAASAPSLLQNALVETIARSGAFTAVASDEASMKADATLAIDLQSFQLINQSGTPNAVQLRLNARVMTLPDREVVKMQSFDVQEPVKDLSMENVASAFQSAYNKLAPQILETTLGALRAQKQAQAAEEAAKHKKKR